MPCAEPHVLYCELHFNPVTKLQTDSLPITQNQCGKANEHQRALIPFTHKKTAERVTISSIFSNFSKFLKNIFKTRGGYYTDLKEFVNPQAAANLDDQAQKLYRKGESFSQTKMAFSLNKRNFFIFSTLILALSFIILAPLVPAISNNIMPACIALGSLFLLIAIICKRWTDTMFLAMLVAIFATSYVLFPATDSAQTLLAIRTCSITAFILFSTVLLIGPWSRFNKHIIKIYWFRRHLGVTVFLLGAMHFRLVFALYFGNSLETAVQSLFTFFGFTTLFILLFMASTSWDWFQKHIKTRQWKILNLLMFAIYCGFTAWVIWVNLKNGLQIPTTFYAIVGGFLIFWMVSAPWGLISKFMKYINGWKQLHVLIYIAYFSIIVHSWGQLAQFQNPWLYVLWVGLPVFVFGSHAVGWYIKLTSEKRLKLADERSEKITLNSFEYRCVGKVEDFKEGIGKRVFVGGIAVAVFKIKGEFFAWFAVCPHQKGPLERGKIEHGYIVCPWHGYQFSTTDGCGPPGFDDSTNLYPTEIRDGKVFVGRVPVPKHKI